MQHNELAQKFISTSELCARYRISSRTLARWRTSRTYPEPALSTVGAEHLYLMEDVEAWEDNQVKKKA
jgi:hypothetical protein